MRAAQEGAPVAGLPLVNPRAAAAPNPFAPLLPPLDITGGQGPAPPPGGRGGGRTPVATSVPTAAPQPLAAAGRPAPAAILDPAPVPPAPIPTQPGQRANDFLNKIFGKLAGAG